MCACVYSLVGLGRVSGSVGRYDQLLGRVSCISLNNINGINKQQLEIMPVLITEKINKCRPYQLLH